MFQIYVQWREGYGPMKHDAHPGLDIEDRQLIGDGDHWSHDLGAACFAASFMSEYKQVEWAEIRTSGGRAVRLYRGGQRVPS